MKAVTALIVFQRVRSVKEDEDRTHVAKRLSSELPLRSSHTQLVYPTYERRSNKRSYIPQGRLAHERLNCTVPTLVHLLPEAKCSQIVSDKVAPMILLYERVEALPIVTRRDVGRCVFFRL